MSIGKVTNFKNSFRRFEMTQYDPYSAVDSPLPFQLAPQRRPLAE
jgi:hypothetical protein